MSTLNVNTINPVQANEPLNFQTGGTTFVQLTTAGSLSAQSLSATQLWGDGSKLSNLPGVSKYTTGWATSHGGVTVAGSAELTITHNLGTTDIIVNIYGSSSSTGAGTAVFADVDSYYDGGSYEFGAMVTEVTTTTIKVNLGANGYREWGNDGTQSWSSKYLKVVVIG